MAERKFVKLLPAQNGRIAVMVRKDAASEIWIQVESILGNEEAEKYANELEHHEDERAEALSMMTEEEWGQDAPIAQK